MRGVRLNPGHVINPDRVIMLERVGRDTQVHMADGRTVQVLNVSIDTVARVVFDEGIRNVTGDPVDG